MRLTTSFAAEISRFDKCGRQPTSGKTTDIGIEQFYEYESSGIKPVEPDPYYALLCNGKARWEWMLNDIAGRFWTDMWRGWYVYAIDFKDDPAGFKQLRQRCGFSRIDPNDYIRKMDEQIDGVVPFCDSDWFPETLTRKSPNVQAAKAASTEAS